MNAATKEIVDLMEILPDSEQNFALEFIRKCAEEFPCDRQYHRML